jgi:hypothetical protein
LDCVCAHSLEAYAIKTNKTNSVALSPRANAISHLKLYFFIILQHNPDIIKEEHGGVLREHSVGVEYCEVYMTAAIKMEEPEVNCGFILYS